MSNAATNFNKLVESRRSVRLFDEEDEFDSSAVIRSLKRAVLAPNSSNLQLWSFYHVKSPEKKNILAQLCLSQPAALTARELVVVATRRDLWRKHVDFMLSILTKGNENGVKVKSTKDTGKVLQRITEDKETRKKAVLQYYSKIMPQLYTMDALGIQGWFKRLYVSLFMAPKKPTYRNVTLADLRIITHKSAALAAQTFMLSMNAEGYDTCPLEGIDTLRIKRFLNLPKMAEICMVIACGKAKPEGIYGPRIRVKNSEVIHTL